MSEHLFPCRLTRRDFLWTAGAASAAAATAKPSTTSGFPARRAASASTSEPAPPRLDPRGSEQSYCRGDVIIDIDAHRIEVAGRGVDLTPTEFRLLETLMDHRGQVLSPEQLLQLAWRDPTATGPDRVKFTVLRLRRKLGWSGAGDGPIETVRGFGYRFDDRV